KIVRDDERAADGGACGDRNVVHQPAGARGGFEGEINEVPGQENNVANVRREVDLLLRPAGRVASILRQRGDSVIRDHEQFAALEEGVVVRKIVTVPETQRGDVAAGQVDRRADEERFSRIDEVPVEVAAPRVR